MTPASDLGLANDAKTLGAILGGVIALGLALICIATICWRRVFPRHAKNGKRAIKDTRVEGVRTVTHATGGAIANAPGHVRV